MKHRLFTLILIVFATIETSCQNQERSSDVDFFEVIENPDYIRTITKEINENEVTFIYYEFYMQDVEIGQGSIFAMSKGIPQYWTEEAIQSPKGECNVEGKKKIFYINCAARRIFANNKEKLNNEFEIYTFFIDKTDLEGPYKETSESGSAEYYNEKADSHIIVYRYIKDRWVKVESKKLGDDIPRTFGTKYMVRLAKEKIK